MKQPKEKKTIHQMMREAVIEGGKMQLEKAKIQVLTEEHDRMPLDHHNLPTARKDCPLCQLSQKEPEESIAQGIRNILPTITDKQMKQTQLYITDLLSSQRTQTIEEIKETIKLWRPWFYEMIPTKEDKKELFDSLK